MPAIDSSAPVWLPLGAYVAGVVSALVPWVNAEALLVSTLALGRPESGTAVLIVLGIAAGQMTGKSAIYWLSRAGGRGRLVTRAQSPFGRRLSRWCDACAASPARTQGLILTSATFGIPPFYLVSVAAGAMTIDFSRFLTIGLVGRAAHFGAIALLPEVWRRI